jgi:hypothetical protein
MFIEKYVLGLAMVNSILGHPTTSVTGFKKYFPVVWGVEQPQLDKAGFQHIIRENKTTLTDCSRQVGRTVK